MHQLNRPHILVVDDDWAIRDVLCDFLVDEGFSATAVSVPPPLEVLLSQPPDAIILDLRAGAHDLGWDFLRALRSTRLAATVQVVVCTTSRLAAADQSTLEAWQYPVLDKPFDLDQVCDLLQNLVLSAA